MGYRSLTKITEHELATVKHPNALIHSPRLMSHLAASTLDVIMINEQLNPRPPGTKWNKFRIKELKWIANFGKSNNTDIFEKVFDEVLGAKSKMNIFGDDPNFIDVEANNFIQGYRYRKKATDGSLDIERGFVHYHLTDMVADIIDKHSKTTEINIISAKLFINQYSNKFYQLGKSVLQGKQEVEITRTIQELRCYAGVEDKYESFRDFNRNVITTPFKDVSKYSDIEISVIEKIKKKRKIHAFRIKIKEKTGFQMALPGILTIDTIPTMYRRVRVETEDQIRKENLTKRLRAVRMPVKTISRIIKERGIDEIEDVYMEASKQISDGYKYKFGEKKFIRDFVLNGWRYTIAKQNEISNKKEEPLSEIEKKLIHHGISETNVREIYSKHGKVHTEEILEYGLKQIEKMKKDNKLKGPEANYLFSLFKKGAGIKTPAERKAEANEKAKKEAYTKAKAEAKEIENLKNEHDSLKKDKVKNSWEKLTQDEKDTWIKEYCHGSEISEFHKGKDLSDSGFKIIFFYWWGKQTLPKSLLDFPAWVRTETGRDVEEYQRGEYRFKK